MYCILSVYRGEPSVNIIDSFEAGRRKLLASAKRSGTAEDVQNLLTAKEEDGDLCLQTEKVSYWLLLAYE